MGIFEDHERARKKTFKILTANGSITLGNFNREELEKRLNALDEEGSEILEVLELPKKLKVYACRNIEI